MSNYQSTFHVSCSVLILCQWFWICCEETCGTNYQTSQSCHPMHNPVKSSRECHMCVCERCACQNLSHIYCTRPPQSQNSCHLLSNSGFWRQYRYIRVIVFSFVSKCLSPVCVTIRFLDWRQYCYIKSTILLNFVRREAKLKIYFMIFES